MAFSTPNFRESEFFIHEKPPADVIARKLPRMMLLAQWLRDVARSPGIVNSYWRSTTRNAEVGGVPNSAHKTGDALDIHFPLLPLRELAQRILELVAAGQAEDFGEMIFYGDLGHVHITAPGVGGRRQLLYSPGKDARGNRVYETLRPATLEKVPTWSAPQKKASARPSQSSRRSR